MKKTKSKDLKKRILLFDRNQDSIELVTDILSDFGFAVETVNNGYEEISEFKDNIPEMIIADIDFPGLNGFEILDKLSGDNLDIPVIITGNLSDKNILEAFRKGASDYLVRPLDSTELQERISVLISENSGKIHDVGRDDIQTLLERVERDNKELNNLLKVSSSFYVSGDSKDILNRLTILAAESMNCEVASIMLINNRANVLEFVVATGEKKQRLETMAVPMGEGIAGWVAVHGKPQIINDTRKDKRFTGKIDSASGFSTKQILAIPLYLENKIIGVLEVINTNDNRIIDDDDLRVLTAIGERATTVIETTKIIQNHQNFYTQITNIIVRAIEKKDMFSEGHAWNVAEWCHKIAVNINMPEEEKNNLHFGALLHDIGKLEISSSFFNKRTLSEREMEYIRRHPAKGAKLLEPINIWKPLIPYILYHHEAWDGRGYPFGNSGDSIPLGARIINLAEAFSVMRAPNSYKKQMSLKDSILEVMRLSGKQFDPEIVKVFISALEKDQSTNDQ